MATVAFTAFLPEVLPLVPGCADVVAVNAIRNAAIEFCSQSNIWQETQDPVDITPLDMPYSLEGASGARVSKVLSLRVNGIRIDPVTMDDLDANYFNWRAVEAEAPTHFYQSNPDEIVFYPMATTTVEAVFRVAYTPLRSSAALEGHIYQNWLEEITSGALYRLMSMVGQPWSNPDAALAHQIAFQTGISEAAAEANKSFSRAQSMVQMRRFA